MDCPGGNRTNRSPTTLEVLHELKEVLGGCFLAGFLLYLLLKPDYAVRQPELGAVSDSAQVETPIQEESPSTTAPNRVEEANPTAKERGRRAPEESTRSKTASSSVPQGHVTPEERRKAEDHRAKVKRSPRGTGMQQQEAEPPRRAPSGWGQSASRRDKLAQPYTTPNRQEAQALFGSGLHKFWSRDYWEAIGRFEAARSVDPDNPAYLYFLALSYMKLGKVDLAETTLADAVKLEAKRPIRGWGTMMERVQGRHRIWLEEARTHRAIRW